MRKKTLKIKFFLLFCSLAGYSTIISAQDKTVKEKNEKDSTIISIPYGSKLKTEFSGASDVISGKVLENVPVQHLSNALSGRISGLTTIQRSGEPGNDEASIYIRGIRSNGNGALVLIDGQERNYYGMVQTQEIERVTILKDASAIALYGMRGANGVILIETKSGRLGKPRVSLNIQGIYQQNMRVPKAVNAAEYAQSYNEANINDGLNPFYTETEINKFANHSDPERYPDVDWIGNLLKKGTFMQRYNGTVEGGSGRTRYFVSLGYTGQAGMFNTEKEQNYSTNTEFSRINFRSNVDFDITSTTLLSVKLDGWMQSENSPYYDQAQQYIFQNLLKTPATAFPMYYKDTHNYVDQSGNPIKSQPGDRIVAGNDKYINPWAILNRGGYTAIDKRYGAFSVSLKQDLDFLLKGLSLYGQISMDVYNLQKQNRTRSFNYYTLQNNGVLQKYGTSEEMISNAAMKYGDARNTTLNFKLSYNRIFGRHNVSGMMFYDQYEYNQSIVLPYRYQTVGGWFAYKYDNRYQIDATFGYQGSYKFNNENRWGLSPTVSLAWYVSNEKFFDVLKPAISNLKIRGSIGKINNDRAVSAYMYMSRLQNLNEGIYFGNDMVQYTSLLETQQANPSATYEESTQMNLGADLGMFSNRLNATFDIWKDRRTGVYTIPSTFSSMLGYTTIYMPGKNIGKMETKGWEASLNWKDNIGKDFAYFLSGNISYSKNKVIDMDEALQPYDYMYSKGHPYGTSLVYIADGIFQSYEEIAAAPVHTLNSVVPGDIRYKDINGDGKIDEKDRVRYGYTDVPQVFYGFSLGGSYKGFSLSVLFQGAAKVSKMLSSYTAFAFYNNGNMYEHQRNRWTPENPSVNNPRFTTKAAGSSNNSLSSTYWQRDASYLRLKNVELSYNLPTKVVRSIGLEELRIFLNGQNLLTFDKLDVIDPEAYGNGVAYPLQRSFSAGINIKF